MKLLNTTPYPAAMLSGGLSDEEMIVTVGLKLTANLDGTVLRPVEPELAWPVFEVPMTVGAVEFPLELHYGRSGVDMFVLGQACAPGRKPTREMTVEISSGRLNYAIDVIGDRRWNRNTEGRLITTEPEPFTVMPLTNDRAYGGHAIVDDAPLPFGMNADGRGFYLTEEQAEDNPLPNLERPDSRIEQWSDQPTPACLFMPLGSSLSKDKQFKMNEDGMPEQPTRFLFQGAVPDLVADAEELGPVLTLKGFTPEGELVYPLPLENEGPTIHVTVGSRQSTFRLRISTLVAIPDHRALVITFVRSFRYFFEPMQTPREVELTWNREGSFQLPPQEEDTPAAEAQPIQNVKTSTEIWPLPRESEKQPVPELPKEAPEPLCLFTAQPENDPMMFLAVRRTYTITDDGRLSLADVQLPLPNGYEYYDDVPEEIIPSCKTIPEGIFKPGTDVVVKGFAHTYGRQLNTIQTGIQVGNWQRSAVVMGRRWCMVQGEKIEFTIPETFDRIALRYENAYGGRDRVAEQEYIESISEEDRKKVANYLPQTLEMYSPFLYPRNPSGKAFVIGNELRRLHGIELPNIEDPVDRLTPQRMMIEDHLHWVGQPLPVCFDWLDPFWFPRVAMIGQCPEYLPVDATFSEADRGFVPNDFIRPSVLELPPSRLIEAVHKDASRGASMGLALPYLTGGEIITLFNIHPQNSHFAFYLPRERPGLMLRIRGKWMDAEPKLYTILIEAEKRRLSLVWCGGVKLDRFLLPSEAEDVQYGMKWIDT